MSPKCLLLLLFAGTATAQDTTRHALDPLTATEIEQAVRVIRSSGRITDQARFGTISVERVAKNTRGLRGARIVGFDWRRNEAFLAVIDLRASRLASFTVVGTEPPMRLLTIRRAQEIARADPRVLDMLRARNLDTTNAVVLVSMAARQRLPREGNDRFVNGFVWLANGVPPALRTDIRMRFNLTQARIVSLDQRPVAMPNPDSAALRAQSPARESVRPLTISQPDGVSFSISGHRIAWDHWQLRVAFDPRRGVELYDVRFVDAGRARPVLYSASVSEIVAPYGDPGFASWYPRDEGDYGMGIYGMHSAILSGDVPPNAVFIDGTVHDDVGHPRTVPRAIAIYERDGGLLWRHGHLSRRARQLVISGHATIDNYDYQFNWILGQDGAIESEVVLSGIMNVTTGPQSDSAHAGGHTSFTHLVAPGISAPNHQHFFSYRLDLDVDGTPNTVYQMDTRTEPGRRNPGGEFFAMVERPFANERGAIADVSFASSRAWRVANTHQRNALGQFTGYTLVPGAVTPLYATPRSAPARAAGFMAHQLWVTAFAPEEQFAAGEFQSLGLDAEGLPRWTIQNRSVRDTDVVLWYTLGVTHIPRPEDWPYMPAHRAGFRLLPTSFFVRNPVLNRR